MTTPTTDFSKEERFMLTLFCMKDRPGLYFGVADGSYKLLRMFLVGYATGLSEDGTTCGEWSDFSREVDEKFYAVIKDKDFSDAEQFKVYLDMVFEACKKKHPEYRLNYDAC